MRWFKLIIYLCLSYVSLAISLPRSEIWYRLMIGPAGWAPDYPHPAWTLIVIMTIIFLLGLILDVGFNLFKLPAVAFALLMFLFGLAIAGYQAEERGHLRWQAQGMGIAPGAAIAMQLERFQKNLGDYYGDNSIFPVDADQTRKMISKNTIISDSPYFYRGMERRPFEIRTVSDANGPVLDVFPDDLPGTIIYAISENGQSYWLTAIAGSGVPAEPRLLIDPDGRPLVISNTSEKLPI